jgi:hypothetical protein
VAEKLGIDLIWFGILLSINMQTSFMHPPFGYALFYLRGVAPAKNYLDKVTAKVIPRVTSGQIYWGAVPFVLLQIVMVALVITFPDLVGGGITKKAAANIETINIMVPDSGQPGGEGGGSSLEDALSRALGGGAEETKQVPSPAPSEQAPR